MNRINKLFAEKKDILSVYYTAGYPKIDDTVRIAKALEKSGAELIEIGMPFSDPLADGPTIQASSLVALENGMTIKVLFEQLKTLRQEVTIPVVLMGYLNPVMRYGIENFVNSCAEVGVDGVILPDLPFKDFQRDYQKLFQEKGLSNIFLITPQTPVERIETIDKNTTGFIYMVSTAAVTGTKKGLSDNQIAYFERVKAMKLKNPAMIGFGISDHESYKSVCKYAQGAIIGSAFINVLEKSTDLEKDIQQFITSVKKG